MNAFFLKSPPIPGAESMVLLWCQICVMIPDDSWPVFLHTAYIMTAVQEKVWPSLSDRLIVYYHNH